MSWAPAWAAPIGTTVLGVTYLPPTVAAAGLGAAPVGATVASGPGVLAFTGLGSDRLLELGLVLALLGVALLALGRRRPQVA